jgi:hypothetical protein
VTDDPLDVTPYSNNPQNHPFHLTPKWLCLKLK